MPSPTTCPQIDGSRTGCMLTRIAGGDIAECVMAIQVCIEVRDGGIELSTPGGNSPASLFQKHHSGWDGDRGVHPLPRPDLYRFENAPRERFRASGMAEKGRALQESPHHCAVEFE